MKVLCPNSREHKEFLVNAHVTQEWKVDSDGGYISTVNNCLDITHEPDSSDYFECATCGALAVTKGHIVELYATVLEGQEDCYADIYNNFEEANSKIGEMIDDLKVVSVKKGYSLAPQGSNILYDEAPDFCKSMTEALNVAKELNISL